MGICLSYPVNKLFISFWCALLKRMLPKGSVRLVFVPEKYGGLVRNSSATSGSSFSWSVIFSYLPFALDHKKQR